MFDKENTEFNFSFLPAIKFILLFPQPGVVLSLCLHFEQFSLSVNLPDGPFNSRNNLVIDSVSMFGNL